jgi:hypothetical protein
MHAVAVCFTTGALGLDRDGLGHHAVVRKQGAAFVRKPVDQAFTPVAGILHIPLDKAMVVKQGKLAADPVGRAVGQELDDPLGANAVKASDGGQKIEDILGVLKSSRVTAVRLVVINLPLPQRPPPHVSW